MLGFGNISAQARRLGWKDGKTRVLRAANVSNEVGDLKGPEAGITRGAARYYAAGYVLRHSTSSLGAHCIHFGVAYPTSS